MDVNDVIDVLNRIMDLGDQLDNAGAGVRRLTNGSNSTRETSKLELSQFLMYIADGCSVVNSGQTAVLSLVLGSEYANIPSYQIKQVAKTISAPDPATNLSFMAFQQADIALAIQNGGNEPKLSKILVDTYEAFGMLMVALNRNPVSQSRCDTVIRQFRDKLDQFPGLVKPLQENGKEEPAEKKNTPEKTGSSSSKKTSAAGSREKSTSSTSKNGGEEPAEKKTTPEKKGSASSKKTSAAGSRKKSTSSTSKKTSADSKKTSSSSVSGNSGKSRGTHTESYNDVIQFALPEAYQMIWETKEDGSRSCKIVSGKYTDDNGQTAYRFRADVSDTEITASDTDPIPAGEKPFDTIHRRDPERRYISLSNAPEAELQVKETPINILGRQLKFYVLALMVQVSQNKLASVTGISSWDEEKPDQNIESYRHMLQVISAVRYKGKALPALKLTAEELFEQLKPDFEGKSSIITGKIGLQIRNGDEVVSDSVLSGDDEGNVHVEDDHHAPNAVDGKYAGYVIKDGGVKGTNKKLTRIEIPDGVTSIESGAFEDYKSLTEVIVPASVSYIGSSAFSGCGKLAKINIPEGVPCINSFTFNGCKALTSITLPESVTWIGMYAFCDCTKLASINLHDKITRLYTGAFQNCTALTKVELPEGLAEIDRHLFNGCKKLETVVIPDTVTSIGDNAFRGCKKLNGIVIPSTVDEIGSLAFKECQALTEIVIPEGIETLEDLIFSDCSGLTSVTLPSSLKAIKDCVFIGCTNLKRITIPAGVESIGDSAFRGCTHLSSLTLPHGIDAIADSLCNGCSSLKEITIPDSVETIGDLAFNACTALAEVSIPDGVKTIGTYAFDECTALKSVSLPGGVELGGWAFPDETDVTYRLGNGRTTKRKPDSSSASSSTPAPKISSSKKTVGKYTAVMPSDELFSHYGKLKREADKFKGTGVQFVHNNGEEFQALEITEILERSGHKSTNVYRKLKAAMSADSYDLDDTALKMSQVFRVNESVFNSRHDDEGDIHERLMDKKWKLSALRSFAWTLADLADREGKSIDDYDYDDLIALCGFIEEREWLNYEEGSWFDGLCGHPDIHVFYMPGKMIDSGEADEICSVLNYSPITSLDAFRSDLSLLKNAMIRLHNGILKTRNRSEKLDSPAAAVLQAWCVMAVSASAPFFSEDGPMLFFHSYPTDSLNTKALAVGAKAASMTKAAPKPKKVEASTGMESAANYEIIRGADGRERIKLGEYPVGSPITWLVLEKKGQELLLLSEYALDAKPFCEASFSVESTNEWHGCTLRTWLNGDFYTEAFSDIERGMILDDVHDTYRKTATGEEQTPSVTDKVFLLSAREVNKYFPQERDRICRASAYAKEHGAEIESGPNQCSWWLRSPAVEMMGLSSWAPSIRADGSGKGWGIYSGETCARPVIRVKSSRFKSVQSGAAVTGNAGRSSSASRQRKADSQQLSELGEAVSSTASELKQASASAVTAQEREAVQKAQELIEDMHSQMTTTKTALEKHQDNLRRQREEKEHQIAEAKKKGKSSHDETNMLAVLLVEESLGMLNRNDDDFAQTYAEDFAAYNKRQLISLRKKVMPTIHNSSVIESAKAEMLTRPLDERFGISTANYFNVSSDWDFDAKSAAAIETTKLWYSESELPQLRQLMAEHAESTRQNVIDQLTSFRPEWSTFSGLRGDLHINISTSSEPVPEAHNLFHVKLDRDLVVQIALSNPALGYISIPVMNLFTSCWKVSPEEIWNAALMNSMTDSRGQSASTRSDALTAKARALSQLKQRSGSTQVSADPAPVRKSTAAPSPSHASATTGRDEKRIRELEESIESMQREADSIRGIFGFIRKRKIQKEIEAQLLELESLKNQRH